MNWLLFIRGGGGGGGGGGLSFSLKKGGEAKAQGMK